MSDIEVWGVGTARTLRVHWALAELGLEYTTRDVQSRTGETQTGEFLAMNPRGKIPVLVDGDFVLAESPAIVTYLADRYGAQSGLAPAPRTRARALYDQWCFHTAMELDAHTLYVMRRHGDLSELYGEAPKALEAAADYFQRQAAVPAAELSDGRPFLLGDTFTGADILLGSTLMWARLYGQPLVPTLDAYRERVLSREPYARAMEVNFPPKVIAAMAAQRAKQA